MRELPSPNCDARPEGAVIDMLVMHYTGMETAKGALDRLVDPQAKVSAHYLVDEDGGIWRLVAEEQRAWHAGVSFWRGHTNINARSIGIELVNPGHDFGYRPYPARQMAACIDLCRDLARRHRIPRRNVVGHSDIAPRRKQDPGEFFDWRALSEAGVGLWPSRSKLRGRDHEHVPHLLATIGYEIVDLPTTIAAFQRHFRPERVDGRLDCDTVNLVFGLMEQLVDH